VNIFNIKEYVMYKLIALTLSLLIVLLGCSGSEERKAKYLQSGIEHFQNDDCKKAKLDFRNVLQIDPKDAAAKVGWARCLMDEKEWRKAFQVLNSAVDEVPTSVDAKINLAKIYLIAGDSGKSYELIEEALTLEPENASGLALRGFFHVKNNTLSAARTDANQAIGLEKDNIEAVTLLSLLYIKDDAQDNAFQLINDTLSIPGLNKRKTKELNFLLIGMYDKLGETDKLIPIYAELMQMYPDDASYRNRLARAYANNNQLDEAEKLLLDAIEEDSDNAEAILSYIAFVNYYESTEAATKKLEEFAAQKNSSGMVRLALGRRYLAQDREGDAKKVFEQLSQDVSEIEYLEAKNELAFLYLKDRQSDEAKVLANEVIAEQANNTRALMVRGTIALSERDAPQAIADYRTILRDDPENALVVRQLAAAYVMNDQKDLAKELVQNAFEANSEDPDLALLHARFQGDAKDFDSAIETVTDILDENEGDLVTIKTLFDLQVANEDFDAAKVTAERLKSESEDNPLGYYLSGALLQNEQKFEEAEQQYLKALEKQPRANEPLTQLVRLYAAQEQTDKALALLNEKIENDPEYLVPYNLRGDIGLATKDYDLAVESYEAAISRNDQWWVPYRGLSLTYAAQGDMEKSMASLQRGFDAGANIERLGTDLAILQYRQGDRQGAINTYERVIQELPESMVAKNNLAMILVDDQASESDIAQAVTYLEDISSIEQAASLDTAGWVNLKAGNVEEAINLLERAVALAPQAAELHYHLGIAYVQSGDITKAKEHLTIAVESEQEYAGKDEAKARLEEI
jgi:tetratricopeptide (TPR) repeat protein